MSAHVRQLMVLVASAATVAAACLCLGLVTNNTAMADSKSTFNSELPTNDDHRFGGNTRDPFQGGSGDPGCVGDVDDDGMVGTSDLLELLADWGSCEGCPTDLDMDGVVGISDLLAILAAWGNCP